MNYQEGLEDINEEGYCQQMQNNQSDYMRETAQKVVELQRTIMRLRSTIKSKEDVGDQNKALIEEMNQYRSKYLES